MADKEKDPPLADKPKLSSLTDFEIRALTLQKEGKVEEFNAAIKSVVGDPIDPSLEEEALKIDPSIHASDMDMQVYNEIVLKSRNPVSLDSVPAGVRKEIEEGLALLKRVVEDKETYNEIRDMHLKAVKDRTDEYNKIRAPVLPDSLKPNEPVGDSGDVSKPDSKPEEMPITVPKKETKSQSEKIAFIDDIKTPLRPTQDMLRGQEPITVDSTMNFGTSPQPAQPILAPLPNCPHCDWDLKKDDLTPVTDDDKSNYVQSILGGLRFTKVYELFNDKYRITFRALTSKESDIAYRQIVLDGQMDLNSKMLAGTDFYWRNLQSYRMVMSLEELYSSDYGTLTVPILADLDIEECRGKSLQSKLIPFLNHVLDTFLPLESTRAVIGHAYFEFQALCDKLQVMAESPNFWKAVK